MPQAVVFDTNIPRFWNLPSKAEPNSLSAETKICCAWELFAASGSSAPENSWAYWQTALSKGSRSLAEETRRLDGHAKPFSSQPAPFPNWPAMVARLLPRLPARPRADSPT